MGHEVLLDTLRREGEAKAAAVREAAGAEARALVDGARAEAERRAEARRVEARRDLAVERARLRDRARMECRRLLLLARDEALRDAFVRAAERARERAGPAVWVALAESALAALADGARTAELPADAPGEVEALLAARGIAVVRLAARGEGPGLRLRGEREEVAAGWEARRERLGPELRGEAAAALFGEA